MLDLAADRVARRGQGLALAAAAAVAAAAVAAAAFKAKLAPVGRLRCGLRTHGYCVEIEKINQNLSWIFHAQWYKAGEGA